MSARGRERERERERGREREGGGRGEREREREKREEIGRATCRDAKNMSLCALCATIRHPIF